jgi:dipeptidyl aminopeptidase/acylaminoacyl peptidase
MPEQTEIDIKGPAGPIQCFVTAPAGRSRPRAAILDIHGGPTWAWGVQSTLDTLLLASAGYLVVRPNIRGSFNRGTQSVTDLLGDWGGVDAADCHAVLDGLVRQKLADPDRLGCFGNSYGGFMVNWLVATSQRFAAGVSSNGVTNQVSAFAGSDFGVYYNDAEGLGSSVDSEGIDSLWRQSPLKYVSDIRTPLLMLQGEQDLRCPASDNEQLFVALRYLRREVEYVLYPESAHEMSWTSRPDRRLDRAERILAWFKKYMAP